MRHIQCIACTTTGCLVCLCRAGCLVCLCRAGCLVCLCRAGCLVCLCRAGCLVCLCRAGCLVCLSHFQHSPTYHHHSYTPHPPTTHLHSFHHDCRTAARLLLTNIRCHTFLSRMHFTCLKALALSMNNTLATNTRANTSLSHEPKTHSPSPAQQAAQAIQSSPSALSPPPRTAPPRPRTPTANRTWSRSCYTGGRARLCCSCLLLTCTPGCLWESFRTSHLEI